MTYSYICRIAIYLKHKWLPIALVLLSIYDLRIDLRILIDSFTFSSLIYTIFDNTLAITVLLISPYLFKVSRYFK